VVWHKRRWRCREALCARQSFTESIPELPSGERTARRLQEAIAAAVGDANRAVSEVVEAFGVPWPTAHTAFVHRRADGVPLPPDFNDFEPAATVLLPSQVDSVYTESTSPSSRQARWLLCEVADRPTRSRLEASARSSASALESASPVRPSLASRPACRRRRASRRR
jgi:hypothetical protein